MANRTVKDAHCIRGTNPQYLIEKIIRSRIYDCRYWKEECFALSAELLVDKAMELKFVGGVFGGNIKPTPFLCLVLKMLQIQPEKDIVIEFIRQEDYKYVRALGAMYMRVVGTSLDCYKYLEPLYNDYRKIRRQNRQGVFEVIHVDEFIDELLHEERVCDIILPRIQKRHVLEENSELEPRISALEDDLEGPESEEEDDKDIMDDKAYDELQYRDGRNHDAEYREERGRDAEYRSRDADYRTRDVDFRNRDDRNRYATSPSPPRRRHSRSPHRRDHSPRRHSRERERDRHKRRRSRSREKERDKGRERDRKHRSRSKTPEKRDKKSSHHNKHGHKSKDHKDKDRSRRA